jgi:hypothetical protein
VELEVIQHIFDNEERRNDFKKLEGSFYQFFLEYASESQGGERAVHPAAAINFQFSSEARLINIDSMITIRQKGDENESK